MSLEQQKQAIRSEWRMPSTAESRIKGAIMFEMLEKVILAGLGAMSLSQKKADELLDELREKYKMSEDEGRNFLEKAENMAKEMKSRLYELSETEVKKTIDRIGLVPRDEFEQLQKRVVALEEKLKNN